MKLLVAVMAFILASGCSFKKDAGDGSNKSSSDKEILANTLSSNFDKLALAISKNDSTLFFKALQLANKSDLNDTSVAGKLLLEMALKQDRYDFFKALLAAGASPFKLIQVAGDGFYSPIVFKENYKQLVLDSIQQHLSQATVVCLEGSLDKTEEYLAENYISPSEQVCGNQDLFSFYLRSNTDFSLKEHFISKYIGKQNSNQETGKIVDSLILVGFRDGDRRMLSSIGAACSRVECIIELRKLAVKIKKSSLKASLEAYSLFLDSFKGIENTVLVKPELGPPPPPKYGRDESDVQNYEEARTGIVTFVKNLVRRQIDQTPSNEIEAMAQQLQELGLE